MLSTFHCKNCQIKFNAEGTKIEFVNAIYGPCAKYLALCPQCNNECDEYKLPKTQKSKVPIMPSCQNGGGCNCCNNF